MNTAWRLSVTSNFYNTGYTMGIESNVNNKYYVQVVGGGYHEMGINNESCDKSPPTKKFH
jgi:hypothetical protein